MGMNPQRRREEATRVEMRSEWIIEALHEYQEDK